MSSHKKSIVREDHSLQRDEYNKAIINKNSGDYTRRLAVKNSQRKKEEEFRKLKSEVDELKELVKKLLSSQGKSLSN